jgi:hypothetical protein
MLCHFESSLILRQAGVQKDVKNCNVAENLIFPLDENCFQLISAKSQVPRDVCKDVPRKSCHSVPVKHPKQVRLLNKTFKQELTIALRLRNKGLILNN